MSVQSPSPPPPLALPTTHVVNDFSRPKEDSVALADSHALSPQSDISLCLPTGSPSPTLSSVSGPSIGRLSLSTASTPYLSRKVLSPRSTMSVCSNRSLSRSRSVSNVEGSSTTCRKCGNTPTKAPQNPRRTSCELFMYDGPVERYLKSEGLDSFGNSESSYDGHEFSSMLSRTTTPQDHERLKEFTALAIDQRDSKLHNQRRQIQRLSVDLSRLNDDCYKSNEYMRESDGKLAKLNQQLSTMRRRLEDAEGRTTVLEERVEWYKNEVKRLEDELEKAHIERRKAFSEKLALYYDVEQAKKDLTESQSELRARSTLLHEAEARVRREVEPLTRKAEELEKQLQEKEAESYDLREASCSLRIELSRSEEAIISLQSENSSLRSGAGLPEALVCELPKSSRFTKQLTVGTISKRRKKGTMLSGGSAETKHGSELSLLSRYVSDAYSASNSSGTLRARHSQGDLARNCIRAAARIRKEWSPIKKPELRHALSSELKEGSTSGKELVRSNDQNRPGDVQHEGRLPTLSELGLLTVAVLVNTGYTHGCAIYDRLQASRLFGCFRRKKD